MASDKVLAVVLEVVAPFVKGGAELTPTLPLIESGVVDSASMVNILLELESRLGIQLDAADLAFDHFQSCDALAGALSARVDA